MKKINNRQQLQLEKLKLELEKEKLQQSIKDDWRSVKQEISVAKLAKEGISQAFHEETTGKKAVLKNVLLFGLDLLGNRLRNKKPK